MTRKESLDSAAKAVLQDRNITHGTPENSFSAIADLWNTYLVFREKEFSPARDPLTAADVGVMMVLFKCGRLAMNIANADNWVDVIGYAACGAELATEPSARSKCDVFFESLNKEQKTELSNEF